MNKRKVVVKKSVFDFIRFKNTPIGRKYLFTFFIAVALFAVATAIVYSQLAIAKNNLNQIIDSSERTNEMAQLALYVERKNSFISYYIPTKNERYVHEYEELDEQLSALLPNLSSYFEGSDNESIFAKVIEYDEKTNDLFFGTITEPTAATEDILQAQIQISTLKTSSVSLINSLIEDVNIEQTIIIDEASSSMDNSMYVLLVANVVSIVMGLAIIFVISHLVSTNLKKVVGMIGEMAKGNLTVKEMDYNGSDEIGQLTKAMNILRANMIHILSNVTRTSTSVTERSKELTQSARDVKETSELMVVTMEELAKGAEVQATSSQHILEQMNLFVESVKTSQQNGQEIANETEDVLNLTSEGTILMIKTNC